jgi:hypothetical protein
LADALQLFRDEPPHKKWRLESYLLTTEPLNTVAARCSVSLATVQTYHDILGVTGRPLATSPVFLGIFGLSARSAALSWDTPDTCTLRDGSEELSPLDGLTTEDTAETPLFSA